jgi:hypothetical protein
MNRSNDAEMFWGLLLDAHPRRTRFTLEHLLATFRAAFPHRQGDTDARSVLAKLLDELEQTGALRTPRKANRRAYDRSERTSLPKHVTRIDRPAPVVQPIVVWRPELGFASALVEMWREELLAIQEWFRDGGATAEHVALRERSVEIFGDEKRLDALLGTQLFAPGRLTLDTLRCYLPTVPIHVVSFPTDGSARPLLVAENHTTFDTLCRWNERSQRYSAVAYGAGAAFVASCVSLRPHLAAPGCSGQLLYFGDLDPKGIWIPACAAKESGLKIQPDEQLYSLLLAKGRAHRKLPRVTISFEPTLLDWLPALLQADTGRMFKSGLRLPQELVALSDLSRPAAGTSDYHAP